MTVMMTVPIGTNHWDLNLANAIVKIIQKALPKYARRLYEIENLGSQKTLSCLALLSRFTGGQKLGYFESGPLRNVENDFENRSIWKWVTSKSTTSKRSFRKWVTSRNWSLRKMGHFEKWVTSTNLSLWKVFTSKLG